MNADSCTPRRFSSGSCFRLDRALSASGFVLVPVLF